MKTITTILLVCFGVLYSQGQDQLKLSIKKGSDTPNSETVQSYLFELSNKGTKPATVNISTQNKECSNVKKIEQTEFNQELLDNNLQRRPQQMVVQPGKSVEFYIKLSKPNGAKLNTWNCTEVVAMSSEGKPLSNAVVIESLIPNPKNNN